jgi:hypothetical protein
VSFVNAEKRSVFCAFTEVTDGPLYSQITCAE